MFRITLKIIIFLFIALIDYVAFSQQGYISLNNDIQYKYENLIYNKTTNFHTSVKPYLLKEIETLTSPPKSPSPESEGDFKLVDSQYYQRTSSKLLDFLLNKNFFEIEKNDFNLIINPIITSILENDLNSAVNPYNTMFGLSLQSNLNKKISLYTGFAYANAKYPEYLTEMIDSTEIIPRFGKFINNSNSSYAFYTATGYLSYSPSQYFNFQIGQDKNFWGDGYRSLLLSDNSNSYPFFKTTVNVRKFKYISLFSMLKDIKSINENKSLQNKYASSHYLSWNIGKRFNINLFETVIWQDSAGYRGFDVNYLNPIIFYRPVEFSLNSPDNVMMGGGFRLRIGKSNHLYGQVILDEFKLEEIKAQNGWWANKQGFQIGAKAYNLLSVNNLFLLAEYNYVRPYTYSHWYSCENYGNYYQPLAHPLGANFKEALTIIRYNYKRWSIKGKFVYAVYGADTSDVNLGQDIYKPYTTRYREYDNYTTQGLKTTLFYKELKIAYLINPKLNLQFEIGFRNRNMKTDQETSNHTFIFAGIRTNIFNEDVDY